MIYEIGVFLRAVEAKLRSASPGVPADARFGGVTFDEFLTVVNIALGNARIADCLVGDNGQITVDQILVAVNNALNGCP